MKKIILFLISSVYTLLNADAQCPVSIDDDSGDGSTYIFTLSNDMQGANYPSLGTVTIQGQSYTIQGAYSDHGFNWAQVIVNATPIIRANNSSITVVIGGLTCVYGAALPVELLSFTAQNQTDSNVLNWATASEINNKGFQIEKRQTTDDNWDIIGFVKAQGKAASYDFTDNTPLSISYYRLRQMDNDGKETLSKVISVVVKGNSKLKVYPNPVSDVLTIEASATGTYDILNLLGQQVLHGKTPPSGVGGLDVSALPQGTYFLKIGEAQVKFVKQ
jgi:hypothetical protein